MELNNIIVILISSFIGSIIGIAIAKILLLLVN